MKRNVGVTDRIIRFVIAAIIAVLFFTKVLTGILGIVLLVFAGVLVITGIVGRCGLYYPFKINTRQK